ncbi:MAG: PilZ domain-containing protein [Sphingomicrobium sp.]
MMRRKIGAGLRGRELRISVAFEATLVEPDGCPVPVQVLDVSSSGFRITCNAELVVDEEVELHLPRASPVRATVCWTRGSEAGGIFLDPAKVA